jgi:tungstate transport system substrate-binding protein
MKPHQIAIILLGVLAISSVGIYEYMQLSAPPTRLVIATTTSTVDTGLLAYLKPYFNNKFKANMTWLYLGTGQAVTVAARGDADILLVHDRVREDAFVKSGNGTHRVTIMYNDFVIVGPQSDPARIRGLTNATLAFQKITEAGENSNAFFTSRGDGSGTNALELRLWSKAGSSPKGKAWYLETGQGMAPAIRIANEKQAYTITDRGTWGKLRTEMSSSLTLQLIVEGDKDLLNPYGLILLNPAKYPSINNQLAEKFFLFMVSDEGQRLIRDFKAGGEQLFYPVFGKPESMGLPSESGEVQYWLQKLRENGLSPPS